MVFTSASTVTTVTYLSLYELEQYKKQFQSFWIPFMEQFIPATTIWVAGERWCNDVCTIIDPCNYDFELVEAEISIELIPELGVPLTPRLAQTTTVPEPNVSTTALGLPTARIVDSTPEITPIQDLGLTITTPIIKTLAEANIDIQAYRNKFTEPTTIFA